MEIALSNTLRLNDHNTLEKQTTFKSFGEKFLVVGSNIWLFLHSLIVLMLFWPFLLQLVELCFNSDLYGHILIIPAICLYFVWVTRESLPERHRGDNWLVYFLIANGIITAIGLRLQMGSRFGISEMDQLSLSIFAFVLVIWGSVMLWQGVERFRHWRFPLFFAIFLVPLPESLLGFLVAYLQEGTADVTELLFRIVGASYYRYELTFELPHLNMVIAPQCCGIRSSLVLFITSILAGQLFLQSTWRKWLIVACALLLGFLRNGFRVFVLGYGTSAIDKSIIDSRLHSQGGPLFFILTMIPIFLLVLFLARSEKNTSYIPFTKQS